MDRRARRRAVGKVDLASRLTHELQEVRLRHDPARLRTVTEVAKVAGTQPGGSSSGDMRITSRSPR